MLTGTNIKYAAANNLRIVMETIRLFGPISQKEISERTGLKLQTVSNITRKLLKYGLLGKTQKQIESRGAPTSLLFLNKEGAFSIGIDVHEIQLTGVLIDLLGNVHQRVSLYTQLASPQDVMNSITDAFHQLCQDREITRKDVWGIGVGLPESLVIKEHSTVSKAAYPGTYTAWVDVHLADTINERLRVPAFLENDAATAAVVHERRFGKGRYMSDFFYLHFDDGIEARIISNSLSCEGHHGNAGEIGVIPTTSGRHSPTGLTDPHLGVFFSLPVLYELLKAQGVSVSSPKELEGLFNSKQADFMKWLDQGISQLTPFILTIECLIDPEAVFIGGRYPKSILNYIKDQLTESLPELRFAKRTTHPTIHRSAAGDFAASLSMATLPTHSSFAPITEVKDSLLVRARCLE